jgi:hypothetical protein
VTQYLRLINKERLYVGIRPDLVPSEAELQAELELDRALLEEDQVDSLTTSTNKEK